MGENGKWANSTGMCPFNTTQANEPIGRALCIGDGITKSQWQPVDNCGPFRNVKDILTEIAKVIVGEKNAGKVSKQVSSVTSNIEDITSNDIKLVAEITSNIVQQNLTSEEVTESITSIVSNVAQVETEELEAAEEEGGAISKFVQAFEEQINRVEVADGGLLNIQQPSVAVKDIHRQEDSFIKAYNILTYIGCCISIFSLLVTLATYLWNKDLGLRTKQTSQIFICLCLTLLCLYTTFVVMISLDSIRDYREVRAGPCGLLTALVHYFVLSSIAWMGVEGYSTYLMIVKIFNTYIQNFMIKAFFAAWGIPALIVVLTGAIARDSYAHDDL
ncbi:adhesion G-protein coupled receptor G2-like [Strongylocentrotus purpuratus]|uniref:G-protein coupled receptors family 2 profile 2 domain-containing protein n=1 Tax=Strongylocentrotus purpuratus TaxID=7668 RepID=A0A7M7NNT6_STRPU|nr:adhesion G-protein coupled receptor G2-like [Strongylocentrotus purpuratus]